MIYWLFFSIYGILLHSVYIRVISRLSNYLVNSLWLLKCFFDSVPILALYELSMTCNMSLSQADVFGGRIGWSNPAMG